MPDAGASSWPFFVVAVHPVVRDQLHGQLLKSLHVPLCNDGCNLLGHKVKHFALGKETVDKVMLNLGFGRSVLDLHRRGICQDHQRRPQILCAEGS